MQRRTVFSSLLLVSLLSLFAFSSALSQPTVTVVSKNSQRCVTGTVDVSVDIAQDASAVEIVLDYSGDGTINNVTFDAGLANLAGVRGFDLSQPGKIRIWALDNSGGSDCLPAGSHVIAQIEYTTNDVCSGSIDFTGGTFTCSTNDVTASSQVATCAQDASLLAATVNAGSVSINNEAPSITCPGDVTMHWGDVAQVLATGSDPDESNGCESLTYSLGAGSPSYASIDPNSGAVTLAPGGGDVCEATVEVIVTDKCGATASCSFNVCVQNTPPVATCPSDLIRVCWSQTAQGQVVATDADSGPVSPAYEVIDWAGPGPAPTVDASGLVSWPIPEDPAYIGTWDISVRVSDGANICDPCSPSNADTCTFSVLVVPTTRVAISCGDPVIQGGPTSVDIYLDDSYENYPMAGFDFLIEYDPSALTFLGANEGAFFTGNEWEYSTFRFGPNGNCGSGCPSGKFRIVALAESNDGMHHPSGYTNVSAGSNVLATADFLVSNDRTLGCQYTPVRFCWYDCGDNAISSVSGDTLEISRYIYDPQNFVAWGSPAESIHGTDPTFPTLTGAPAECETSGGPGKPEPLRKVDFLNGCVKIICPDSIDARGDINLNGLSNEIADAVVFTNYFVQGLGAFNVNVDGQIAATEINGDGIPLTVADLVYLIRVIVGDALPLERVVHNASSVKITSQGDAISVDRELGAALFVFEGKADVQLTQTNMDMEVGMREGNTYALVYNIGTEVINPGQVLTATSELISVEAVDYYGAMLSPETNVLPTEFAVSQNYPNPFNPSTKIAIDLPTQSEYKVSIFNVAGQLVDVRTGSGVGYVEVEWDASNFASGVYFYKVEVADLVVTKKMVLLK